MILPKNVFSFFFIFRKVFKAILHIVFKLQVIKANILIGNFKLNYKQVLQILMKPFQITIILLYLLFHYNLSCYNILEFIGAIHQ